MAAFIPGIGKILCRVSPLLLQNIRQNKRLFVRLWTKDVFPGMQSSVSLCTAASLEIPSDAAEASARYKDSPWDYLESEEYIVRYGNSPVWSDYRRNHKGGIPPQKTRKTCIRGDKICGNPCPICRDPNIIIHHQNVKLLQQFISPYTGMVYDGTRTGVCEKQQKQLNKAIGAARDHGLLAFQIPHVDFAGEDYSNSHDAVGLTPAPPTVNSSNPWYWWYDTIQPDETEVAKVRKTYKAYLK
ncbi:28S ribosomal protein S18b, mitochondrial [Esox lucius]|uniref:Small ribosomal subunit protein mS40 n=1 Tax=Esox lucius TaxID=8010 RepID=C1BYY2_ESOLU|nr:28S ribosomal protein S18b, mitochondrial [Esox lucius]ACO14235.1 28S ribosomal protein S18b, mitochondrial precursor [Esox lucius]